MTLEADSCVLMFVAHRTHSAGKRKSQPLHEKGFA